MSVPVKLTKTHPAGPEERQQQGRRGGGLFSPRFMILLTALAVLLAGIIRPLPLKAQAPRSGSSSSLEQSLEQSLDGGDWLLGSFAFDAGVAAGAQTESFNESNFRRVQVPGDVQLQLGFKGQDLFRQTRELTVVNNQEWWYRKHFKAAPLAAGKRAILHLDGADYFASVWLNGKLLGEHEGTYVPFSFDVTSLLRSGGDNVLAVRVTHPWIPKDRGLSEYMNGDFSMTVYTDALSLSHPPYTISMGWDGLPAHGNAAFAMGLWRSVRLTTIDQVALTDLYVRTKSIEPDGSALVAISGAVENAGQDAVSTSVELSISPATFTGETLKLAPIALSAAKGKTAFSTEVRVKQARLWWTWDLGAQDMYQLTARIAPAASAAKTKAEAGAETVRFGIRTFTRDTDMTSRLNGKRVFVKASWFPIEDYYRSRPTRNDYDRDLRLFRDANLNQLVNFTVVEKPEFYDLCDELGIMVVEEMPFQQFGPGPALAADSPRHEPFLKEAAKEVTQIIVEHRNHPSVIEWVPLAEAHDQGGGWGFGGIQFDQANYQIFSDNMRKLVAELSPGTYFHPSTCDLGEKHFWMATAGYRGDSGDYQQHFDAQVGFVSEYGGISMSSYEKLGEYLTPKEQWDPSNKTEPRWYGLPIDISAYSYLTSSEYDALYSMLYRSEHYIDRDIRSPRELVDDTQEYQGFLLKYATEAYRRKKYEPIMGIRFWDFVELGPGFRFGIVDYDHIPKVSYWWMKRAQSRLSVSFAYKDALEAQVAGSKLSIPVWAINDLDHAVDARVDCGVYDLQGHEVFSQVFNKQIEADGKAEVGSLDWTLPEQPGVYFVRASLASSNQQDRAEDNTFVKVVPRAFAHPVRVLLIGQSSAAKPIAGMLRGAGIGVDVRDEEYVGSFDELADGAALRARYDVIWLANFENLAKVFSKAAAQGVQQAVSAGAGFIHTGGISSYHGGQSLQALVDEIAPLADLMPVAIQGRNDLLYGEHTLDDNLQTEPGFKDIVAAPGADFASLPLLQRYGIRTFNRVTAKPGSRTLVNIHDQPLLVTGEFGQGRTVSFTGFTPVLDKREDYLLGQQLIRDPANRAYFETFIGLVALATGQNTTLPPTGLLDATEKPLFQTLKEQPTTQIGVRLDAGQGAKDPSAHVTLVRLSNGASYAHLVRLRVEWDSHAPQPYLTEFGDNAFEMLPGEEKTVALSWRLPSGTSSASGTLIVDGANVTPSKVSF
jgi:beta-mannosidase